ncbi:MAG: hypothetical protein ACM3SY_09665, partial [Candidatus Omnitrophota bacterium]
KAQLKSLEVKKWDNESKFEVTKELIRQCSFAGYSKDTIRTLLTFIEWVIRLPEIFKDRIFDAIKQVQEETKMEYVPMWARDIRKEGKLEGLTEGRNEGRNEGLTEGRDEGLNQGLNQGRKEAAERMMADGLAISTISKYLGISVEEIKNLTAKTH